MLSALAFRRSSSHESLLIRDNGNEDLTIVVSYVDDMLLVGSGHKELHKIARKMEEHVELRVETSLTELLGIRTTYNLEMSTLNINRKRFMESIVKIFNMEV